jgi:hypothetical protein
VDPTTPSPARLDDYYLGGTHNLPVDRAMAAYGYPGGPRAVRRGRPATVSRAWRRRPAVAVTAFVGNCQH